MSAKSQKLHIVMYHYTRDIMHSRYPGIKGLDISLFKQQIEFFSHNFNVVSMEQVLEVSQNNGNLPSNALLLTFDDGYIDNYAVALPILEEYGMQGSFFIPGKTFIEHKLLDVNKLHLILASAKPEVISDHLRSRMDYYRGREYDFPSNDELSLRYSKGSRYDDKDTVFIKQMLQTALPEKLRNIIASELLEKYVGVSEEILAYELYMTEDQIKNMKNRGMFIGLHGYDHYWLGNLPIEVMHQDIDKAINAMEPYIDKENWVMNYPYGSYNDEVLSYIEKKGCKLGLVTKVRRADIGTDNRLMLPRFDCNDFPPKSSNYLSFSNDDKD